MKKITIEDLMAMVRETVGKSFAEQWEAARKHGEENKHTANFTGDPAKTDPRKSQARRLGLGEEPTEPGLKAARFIRYMYQASKGAGMGAAGVVAVARSYGDDWMEKAIMATDWDAAGAWIPPGWRDEIIELLQERTVIRRQGIGTIPMPNGTLNMPYAKTGPAASYVGESQNATPTNVTGGQLQLADKKLMATLPVSNDFLRSASPGTDAFIRNLLIQAFAAAEDLAFLRGDGADGEPKGLRYWAQTVFAANGTVNVANVTVDLGKAVYMLEDLKIDIFSGAWSLSPRSKFYLMTARDGNNNLVWEPEMKAGTLMGLPWYVSTQIPNNLGGGTESEVYLTATEWPLIAEHESMMLEMFPDGTYHDGTALQSGISRDESVMRGIEIHDFGCQQRGKEAAVITTVKWGV